MLYRYTDKGLLNQILIKKRKLDLTNTSVEDPVQSSENFRQ